MDLLPSSGQLDMMAAVEQFLDRGLPSSQRHALVDTGKPADQALWRGAAESATSTLGQQKLNGAVSQHFRSAGGDGVGAGTPQ
jgi:hypothetical protein